MRWLPLAAGARVVAFVQDDLAPFNRMTFDGIADLRAERPTVDAEVMVLDAAAECSTWAATNHEAYDLFIMTGFEFEPCATSLASLPIQTVLIDGCVALPNVLCVIFGASEAAYSAGYLGGLLSDEARVAIHLTHRLGSIVVTLVLLSLIFSLYKNQSLKVAGGLSGALALQIGLGISNVIFSLPLLIAVGHNLGGLLLITYLAVLRFRE